MHDIVLDAEAEGEEEVEMMQMGSATSPLVGKERGRRGQEDAGMRDTGMDEDEEIEYEVGSEIGR